MHAPLGNMHLITLLHKRHVLMYNPVIHVPGDSLTFTLENKFVLDVNGPLLSQIK